MLEASLYIAIVIAIAVTAAGVLSLNARQAEESSAGAELERRAIAASEFILSNCAPKGIAECDGKGRAAYGRIDKTVRGDEIIEILQSQRATMRLIGVDGAEEMQAGKDDSVRKSCIGRVVWQGNGMKIARVCSE